MRYLISILTDEDGSAALDWVVLAALVVAAAALWLDAIGGTSPAQDAAVYWLHRFRQVH